MEFFSIMIKDTLNHLKSSVDIEQESISLSACENVAGSTTAGNRAFAVHARIARGRDGNALREYHLTLKRVRGSGKGGWHERFFEAKTKEDQDRHRGVDLLHGGFSGAHIHRLERPGSGSGDGGNVRPGKAGPGGAGG
jgi:hypothetical protein